MLTLVAESPNMSVRMMAPCPSSTDAAAVPMRSFRLSSVSSAAAPTATMPGTEWPSTLSTLRSTAGASAPWPTRTMPIIAEAYSWAPHVPVLHLHRIAVAAEAALELLDDRHRAMAAPGAADADREVALSFALV